MRHWRGARPLDGLTWRGARIHRDQPDMRARHPNAPQSGTSQEHPDFVHDMIAQIQQAIRQPPDTLLVETQIHEP